MLFQKLSRHADAKERHRANGTEQRGFLMADSPMFLPSLDDVLASWSCDGKYKKPRGVQRQIFKFGAEHRWNFTVEAPTGSGKTRAMWTILQAFKNCSPKSGELVWVVPNKAILAQHLAECPKGTVEHVYGQNEYECPWAASDFSGEPSGLITEARLRDAREQYELPHVDEVPDFLCRKCPHFVCQETGQTEEPGVLPCPYYFDRYRTRQGGIVLCTWAFFLFTHLFVPKKQYKPPSALVIDEVHTVGDLTRCALSFDITDWHLEQCITLLKRIEAREWKKLRAFRTEMRRIVKRKPPREETLLKDAEVAKLLDLLIEIDGDVIASDLEAAVDKGLVDKKRDLKTINAIERLTRDLRRYITSFEYSLEDPRTGRKPLQYTCAYYVSEPQGGKVQYKLVVRSWAVSSLIKKMLSPCTMAFSATIGKDPEMLKFDCGIEAPLLRLGSNFPVENTRIYMPDDTPDLAYRAQKRFGTSKVLKRVARAAKRCADRGVRTLVIVVSEKERQMFLEYAQRAKLNAVSYGNERTAKEAALAFRDRGEGDCLVGTEAVYATGIDLPYQPRAMERSAPIIFILRPGLPNPHSAEAQFAQKRFGRQYWALQTWKAMLKALQARGRNVRGVRDLGCAIFISQQFRSIVFPSLPVWLEKAYRRGITFDQAVRDALKLVAGE